MKKGLLLCILLHILCGNLLAQSLKNIDRQLRSSGLLRGITPAINNSTVSTPDYEFGAYYSFQSLCWIEENDQTKEMSLVVYFKNNTDADMLKIEVDAKLPAIRIGYKEHRQVNVLDGTYDPSTGKWTVEKVLKKSEIMLVVSGLFEKPIYPNPNPPNPLPAFTDEISYNFDVTLQKINGGDKNETVRINPKVRLDREPPKKIRGFPESPVIFKDINRTYTFEPTWGEPQVEGYITLEKTELSGNPMKDGKLIATNNPYRYQYTYKDECKNELNLEIQVHVHKYYRPKIKGPTSEDVEITRIDSNNCIVYYQQPYISIVDEDGELDVIQTPTGNSMKPEHCPRPGGGSCSGSHPGNQYWCGDTPDPTRSEGNFSGMPDPPCAGLGGWYYTDNANKRGELYTRTKWYLKYIYAPEETGVTYYYKIQVGPWLIANVDRVQTTMNTPLYPIDFLVNDMQCGTQVKSVAITQPRNGVAEIVAEPSGYFNFRYTPNPGFGGLDTFRYTIYNDDTPRRHSSNNVIINVTSDYNLSIHKTLNTNAPTDVNEGDLLEYKITVNNLGTMPVNDIYVLDTIRNVFSFHSATVRHTVQSPKVYKFDVGTLLPGANRSFLVTCKVKGGVDFTTQNSAIVWSSSTGYTELEVLQKDNYSIAPSIPINSDYNLQIKKELTLDSEVPGKCDFIGQNFSYKLTVSNIGKLSVSSATIIDTMPQGVRYIAGAGAGNIVSVNNKIVTWQLPALQPQESLIVFFTVEAAETGTWLNRAHVRGFNGNAPIVENLTDNVSEVPVIVPGALNPSIVKTTPRSIYNVGDIFSYTVKLNNRGTEVGRNIIIRDILPAELEYEGKVQYNSTVSLTYDAATRVVIYKLPALGAHMVDSFKIMVKAKSPAEKVVNSVKLEMEQSIEYPTSQCEIKVIDGLDIGVTMKANPFPTVETGKQVEYTITVTNYSARATNAFTKLTLPSGLGYVSDSENAFIEPLGKLEWRINRINIGESKTLVLVCRVVGTEPQITLKVEAENDQDTNPSNNTSEVTVQVVSPPIDMSITKSTTQQRTFWTDENGNLKDIVIPMTITIKNSGFETAKNVVVTDTLPTDFFMSTTPPPSRVPDVSTTASGLQILKWSLGSVSKNATEVITFNVGYPAPRVTPYKTIDAVNKAWVFADDYVNDTKNHDTCAFSIINDVDLWITKSTNSAIYQQGEKIEYTLTVENKGRVAAGEFEVRDVLPMGFRPAEGSIVPEGTYDENTNTLSWRWPALQTGNNSAIFRVSMIAEQFGNIENTAIVVDPSGFLRQHTKKVYVQMGIDLKTSLEANPRRVSIGDNFQTTYTIKNEGTYPAKDLLIESQLPENVLYTLDGEVPEKRGLFVNKTAGSVVWNLEEVVPGGEEKVTLNLQGEKEGENVLLEYRTIYNRQEQTAFDEVQIVASLYDLMITKTVSDAIVESDEQVPFTYTLTVQNVGMETLDKIEVRDTLPANMSLVGTQKYKGEVNLVGNVVCWSLSELSTYEEQTLELMVTVQDTGKYVNTAEIFSTSVNAELEKNKSNNRSTVTVYARSGLQKWQIMQIFTPNGDGKNDLFVIPELGESRYADNEILIFNRSGNEVFYAKPYNNDWSGGDLQNDTYFYRLQINIAGSKVERKGFIQLKRN